MTKKQKRFVEEYLIDLNATQAAIRAGYKAGNAQRASEIGSELLQKTPVADAISKAMAERSRRTGVSADRVIQELDNIPYFPPERVTEMSNLLFMAVGFMNKDSNESKSEHLSRNRELTLKNPVKFSCKRRT